MNKMILKGNLTADPKRITAKNEHETIVAKFAVATRRPYEDGKSDFFHCTAFGKRAVFILNNFNKGKPILVTGHFENDNFRNKNDEQVYGYNLIVDEVEFAGERRDKKNQSDGESLTPANETESFNFLESVLPFGVSYGE